MPAPLLSLLRCPQEQLQQGGASGTNTGPKNLQGWKEQILIFSAKFYHPRVFISWHKGKCEGMNDALSFSFRGHRVRNVAALSPLGWQSLQGKWLHIQQGQWGYGISKGGLWALPSCIDNPGYTVSALCIQNSLECEQVSAHWHWVQGQKGWLWWDPPRVAWKCQEAWKQRHGEKLDK